MNSYNITLWIHLISVFSLVGVTFAALSNPEPSLRKTCLKFSGMLGLVALLTGWGMVGIGKLGLPGWVLVKTALWFVLVGVTGIAFRMPQKSSQLKLLVIGLVAALTFMVTFKPF